MFSPRFSFVFLLAILSPFAEATTEETLEERIFDRDLKITDEQMLALLKKVDLESHGYKKEVTTKLVSEPGSDKPVFKKSILYYKIVDCSRLREIDQELQTLMPGILGLNLVTKINTEIKTKNLMNMKSCKVGLEVHFHQDCSGQKKSARRRKREVNDQATAKPTSSGCTINCIFCWFAKLSHSSKGN